MINKQTTLDLNGPILSFTSNPVGVATTGVLSGTGSGIVTFTGIATATFPTTATNTGTIAYQWYEVGVGALSDSTYVTGTGTSTLTLSRLITPTDNSRKFYVTADYVPSAYQSSSPVTAGTARSTGNAINEPISSGIVTVTVYPLITISQQPVSATVSQNNTATFTVSASSSDGSSLSYQWSVNGSSVSDGGTISGATTPTLTISSPSVSTNTVSVTVSHPTAGNSPVTSSGATWTVVAARAIINLETYGGSSSAILDSVNLATSTYTHTNPTSAYPVLGFYAPEKDVNLELEIYAAKGADNGSFSGGQGGVSVIRFTARQNEEYVIAPLPQANQGGAVFIYRKAKLIAVVGAGGDAGSGGNGGPGGGVNVAGADGNGRGAGRGGQLYSVGTLPFPGIFGSNGGVQPISGTGDSRASAPDGGRVLPCARGDYWRNQGYGACDDLGNVQFFWFDGTRATNSATISRGHKIGYGIRQTSGARIGSGGIGGQGATGGQGGTDVGGGGGGSGYSDGSITIVSTQQGGSAGVARVIFRLAL